MVPSGFPVLNRLVGPLWPLRWGNPAGFIVGTTVNNGGQSSSLTLSINSGSLTSSPTCPPTGHPSSPASTGWLYLRLLAWGIHHPPTLLFHGASLDPVYLEAPAFPDLSGVSFKSALKLAFLSIRPPAFFRAQGLQSFLGRSYSTLPPVFSLF